MSLSWDRVEVDAELSAAMAYRDGKILLVVLVASYRLGGFVYYAEDQPEVILGRAKTRLKAQIKADQYIAGYMAGYDEGLEQGHECCGTYECAQESKRINVEVPATRWHQRRRNRVAPSEGQRRDRTHDSGAGEGIGQD